MHLVKSVSVSLQTWNCLGYRKVQSRWVSSRFPSEGANTCIEKSCREGNSGYSYSITVPGNCGKEVWSLTVINTSLCVLSFMVRVVTENQERRRLVW